MTVRKNNFPSSPYLHRVRLLQTIHKVPLSILVSFKSPFANFLLWWAWLWHFQHWYCAGFVNYTAEISKSPVQHPW